MRQMGTVTRLIFCAFAMSSSLPTTVWANPNDISIRGLGRPQRNDLTDPAVLRYKRLSNELAISMAPRGLSPAETLGMSGFEFSLVTSHINITEKADFWQGQPGSPIFEGVTRNRDIPSWFWVPTAQLRKGLPLSTEIGITGSYLAFSEMFMLGGELKIALHEMAVRSVPALSARLAFARMFGNSDLDIITGEWDVLTSLPFGVGGMFQLTPYAGFGQLLVDVSSQVIDETPYTVTDGANDQRGGPDGSLYTFPRLKWTDNSHWRVMAGTRFIVAFLEVLVQWDLVLVDDGPSNLSTYSIKLGFDV